MKNFIVNWLKERKLDSRDYQINATMDMINSILEGKRTVLGIAPNGGKTLMSIIAIDYLLSINRFKRVLITTHGTTILRSQYSGNLTKYKPNFSWREIIIGKDITNSTEQVIVSIPQTIINQSIPPFDLIVIDEGHQYLLGKGKTMLQKIMVNIKNEIILTGSPFKFTLKNLSIKNYYNIITVAVEELPDDISSKLRIELATANYKFSYDDYRDDEIRNPGSAFGKKETIDTLDSILNETLKRIKRVNTNLGWFSALKSLKKTMFVCKSRNQSKYVYDYLLNEKINCKLSISNEYGEDEFGDDQIIEFMEENDCKALVVCGRGVLGFNYTELMNIVDLTCSTNVDRIWQLIARLFRKSHVKDEQKFFFKIVSPDLQTYAEGIMNLVMNLIRKEIYEKFNTKNTLELEIPLKDKINKFSGKKSVKGDTNKKVKIPYLDLTDDCIVFMKSITNNKDKKIVNPYAYTTLKDIKNYIFKERIDWGLITDDEIVNKFKGKIRIYSDLPSQLITGYLNKDTERKERIIKLLNLKDIPKIGLYKDLSDEKLIEEGKKFTLNKIDDLPRNYVKELRKRKLVEKFSESIGYRYQKEKVKSLYKHLSNEELLKKGKEFKINEISELPYAFARELRERKLIADFCKLNNHNYRKPKYKNLSNDELIEKGQQEFKSIKSLLDLPSVFYKELTKRKLVERYCDSIGYKYRYSNKKPTL